MLKVSDISLDVMSRNMRILTIILISLNTTNLLASLPLEVSMLKVVEESDHVLTVIVVDIDMIDDEGTQVEDLDAMTGPGLNNSIRLVCEVKQVHRTNAKEVPKIVKIALDGAMHYSLGQIKKAHKGKSYPVIAVLKGSNFQPAYAGVFRYPLRELETILALYDRK